MRLKLACLNGTRRISKYQSADPEQISEIFLEFVESVFRGKRIFTFTRWRDKEKKKKTLSNRFEIVGENHSFIVSFVNFFPPSVEGGEIFSSARKIVANPRTMADRAKNKQVFPSGIRTKENAISETADSGVIGMAPCRHFRRGR